MEPISTVVMMMLISFPFCCHVIGFNLIISSWSSEAHWLFNESGKYLVKRHLNLFLCFFFMQESGDGGFPLVPVVEALWRSACSCRQDSQTYFGMHAGSLLLHLAFNPHLCVSRKWLTRTETDGDVALWESDIFLFYRCCGLTVYSPCAVIYTLTPVVITLWTVLFLFLAFQRTTKQTTSAAVYTSLHKLVACMENSNRHHQCMSLM